MQLMRINVCTGTYNFFRKSNDISNCCNHHGQLLGYSTKPENNLLWKILTVDCVL